LLYSRVAKEQAEFDYIQAEDPVIFTDISIDPVILASEQAYRAKGNPFSQLYIRAISEETEGLNREIEEAREKINGGISGEEMVLYSLLSKSIILTNFNSSKCRFCSIRVIRDYILNCALI
jgi:hypothetical protein